MALAIAILAGCVGSSSVTCPDGTVCREGTACAETDTGYACIGAEPVCGNGLTEEGEVCDDGNTRIGDGCSPDCLSDETCGNENVDPVRLEGERLVPAETCDDGALVGHDGCSSTCVAETLQLVRVAQSPRVRERTAMATDHANRRIVMFGGFAGDINGLLTGPSSDTWELTRDGWTRIDAAISPSPRDGHAMAYDGTRIVLYGGIGADDETWVLEDRTWRTIAIPDDKRPLQRSGHAMAYLPGTGVVMFGGHTKGGFVTDETWVFANDEWTLLQPATRPEARGDHVMTYDPVRNELLLVGGWNHRFQYTRDTWSFDGTDWTLRDTATTPELVKSAAAYDARTDRIVVYGGAKDEISTGSTYVWNGTQWTTGIVGPPRHGHAAAVDPDTGDVVAFGGISNINDPCPIAGPCPPVLSTVLDYSLGWQDRRLDNNEAEEYAVAFDPKRRRMVAVTGNRTYERGAASWRLVDTSFIARSNVALGLAPVGEHHHVLLFGGTTGGSKSDEQRTWDGTTWSLLSSTTRPSARSHAQMAYDERRDRTILFGGRIGGAGDVDNGETWEWNGSDWRQITTSPAPPARSGHAMAFDPHTGTVILFGGGAALSATNEMWSLDGDTWQRIEVSPMPSARRDSTLAWDPARRVLVLAGGTPSSNIWEWNGTAWRFTGLDLEGRVRAVGSSSPTGAGIVVVGGRQELFATRETLHIVATSPEEYATCRLDTDDDGDGLSGCMDLDCWSTCTPFCSPSQEACDSALPHCGDGVCDEPREQCGICADCTCGFCGDLRCDASESATSCPGDC